MTILFLLCLTTLGAYLWYNYLPGSGTVLARAPAHHDSMRGGGAIDVKCQMLKPPRQEEAEFARFYVGCTDRDTPEHSVWIYAWHSWEDGRRFSKSHRPVNLKEAPEWNR